MFSQTPHKPFKPAPHPPFFYLFFFNILVIYFNFVKQERIEIKKLHQEDNLILGFSIGGGIDQDPAQNPFSQDKCDKVSVAWSLTMCRFYVRIVRADFDLTSGCHHNPPTTKCGFTSLLTIFFFFFCFRLIQTW